MLENDQEAPQGENDAARAEAPSQSQEARQEPSEATREEGQEGAPEPEAAAEGDEGQERAEEQAEPEREQPELPAWMQKRLNELTRQRHDAERRAKAAEERLARFNQAPTDGDGAQAEAEQQVRQRNPGLSQDDVEKAAARIVAEQQFNNDCNAAFEAGAAKYPDFERTVQKFQNLGGLPQDFITDALSAGNAHLTLYHLGRNLDEADRVMSLPPRQRMAALARLSDRLAAPPPPKPISRAPAPIEPVNGAGRPSALNTDPDALSTAEWMRRRDAGEIR